MVSLAFIALLATTAPFDRDALISIRFETSAQRPWSVEWHLGSAESSPASRVYLHLRSTELTHCLTSMIESDDETRSSMLRYASDPTAEHAMWATKAAWRLWSPTGLDEAVREVLDTGKTGAATDRVLASCRAAKTTSETANPPSIRVGEEPAPELAQLDALPSKDQRVTLKLENVYADKVIDALAEAGGFRLDKLGPQECCRVSVSFDDIPLRQALERLADRTSIHFELGDAHTLGVVFPSPPVLSKEDMKGVTPPEIVRRVQIEMPEDLREGLRKTKERAKVILQVFVRDDGTVGDVMVTKHDERWPAFEEAAIKAAKQWIFRPAMKERRPIGMYYTLRFDGGAR